MGRKTFWILLIILGLGIIGCNSAVKTDLIAEVNGEKISRVAWEERFLIIKKNYETRNNAGQSIDEKKDKELIKNMRDNAFDNLVAQALLRQDAKSKGIIIEENEVDALIDQLKANKSDTGQDEFTSYMQANGMDEKQLRDEMKMQLLINKMQASVSKSVKVSDEEIKKFYDDNKASFMEAGGTQISHILVASEKEAKDILLQLQQGQDFAALAKKYSTCPSKEQGGDLGIVNQDTSFVTEFKTAALKLKPGEMTKKPVKTESGYHIIKAGAAKEARSQSFDEVKNQIMMNLQNEKQNSNFNNYVEELRKKSDIKDYRAK
ncbi:MAG: SurA N-terminal domain-containing protein [Syntrophomonadaceae bacterium]|nr:SurA N-terminal domain-containing protein [Syntrophomonadaceae bacterium]